jgi:carbamoyl-phosphate synthase large subunit
VQFAVKDGTVFILEVNPRASRTVPFVAKATGRPIAKIAARLMVGEKLADFGLGQEAGQVAAGSAEGHVAVKEAVFPFARFPGVDIILGPEMKSTGEVMGLDKGFDRAFAKAQIAGGTHLPESGCVFVSVKDGDKADAVEIAGRLSQLGFTILATRGTARMLRRHGLECEAINKVLEGRPHIVDAIKNGDVDLVFNTTEGAQAVADSFSLRRAALTHHIPYFTTEAGMRAATQAIATLQSGGLEVAPLQSYPVLSI